MIKTFNSVPVKLSLRFMIMLTAAVLTLSVLFSLALRHNIRIQQHTDLRNSAEEIMQKIKIKSTSFSVPYFISYVVYNSDTNESIYSNDPFLPFLQDSNEKSRRYISKNFFIDGDLNILYYATTLKEKGTTYIIETALNMDTDSSSLLLKGLPETIALAVIPVLVLSFFASFIITRNTIKPVVKMTQTAKYIGSENLDKRLPVKHSEEKLDENDELALTFNDLFARLKTDFDREKNFTSDVSHELKTPVAVILGQSNLLRRWGKNDAVQLEKSLGIIIKEAHSMESIITNLLQLSRLESGRQKPVIEKLQLQELFKLLKEETHSYSPETTVSIQDNGNCTVYTDKELLHQVCTVIISNSIKFTESADKKAEIGIKFQKNKKRNTASIVITDNGPGFTEESLPHIFDRFYRGDSSHNRKAGGSGLGLSIAKTIMTALGGSISAKNIYSGKNSKKAITGAELKLTLPVSI
ncbi:MAG: two-component sensor histidine kinase [Treponema sp.]|nr:two-component sensor histidine kinase [Treponema sp.]